MPRRLRLCACLALVLAILFEVFFQVSKHQPALAAVIPFADDPYDAIGSFATQFALAAALLGLVRAFRPFGPIGPTGPNGAYGPATDTQQRLLSRTVTLAALAVVVTMAGDGVALARHRPQWDASLAGMLLAGCVVALAVVALGVVWLARSTVERSGVPIARSVARVWLAVVISLCAVVLLMVYPEEWTQRLGTELVTVAAGILLLFVPLWALDRALYGAPARDDEDALDDLTATSIWLRARVRPLAWLAAPVAFLARTRPVRAAWGWLNPRWHPIIPAVVLGLIMGAGLLVAQMLGEGGPAAGRFLLIAAIFLGAECFGVLVGYALLARPLGLFRREPAPSARHANPVRAR